MGMVILTVLLGVVFLTAAAEFIIRGSAGLTNRLGINPYWTGLVLVSLATALPEISVSIQAMRMGQPSLALGTIIGNNIVNFGLTMSLAAIVATLFVAWRALNVVLIGLIIGTIALIVMGWNGGISATEGLILIALYLVFLVIAILGSKTDSPEVRHELQALEGARNAPWLDVVFLVIGLVMLYFGSMWIVERAPAIGRWMGMSPLLVGMLPIALAITLPEVIMAIVGARRGHGDMIVGHVIGSSFINSTLVIGLLAVSAGNLYIPGGLLTFELPLAAIGACLMYPMLRGDMRIERSEGILLLITFFVWLGVELWMGAT